MTLAIPDSPMNRDMAASVSRRIHAEAAIVAGKALFWRLTGAGILLGLSGLGVGAAIFAYSYVTDNTQATQRIAAALSKALAETTLKAEGRVEMADGTVHLKDGLVRLADGTVRLAEGGTVRVASGGTVALDPAAKIQIAGRGEGGGVPEAIARQAVAPPGGGSVNTSFTVFKDVPSPQGNVTTGWRYAPSDTETPEAQYCYIRVQRPGMQERIDLEIGQNGSFKTDSLRNRLGIDARAAFGSCVWHDGD